MEAGMKAYHRGLSQDDSSDSSYMVTGDAGGLREGGGLGGRQDPKEWPFQIGSE